MNSSLRIIRILLAAVVLLQVRTSYAQRPSYIPKDGLLGWWPFTGNTNDESGNGNDGTASGARLTSDRFGKSSHAYAFDGIDDHVRLEQNLLPLGKEPRTVSAWFKHSSTIGNDGCVFAYGSAQPSSAYMIETGDSIISNQGWGDDFAVYTRLDTSWHHLVCTYDGQYVSIHLDGVVLGGAIRSAWNTVKGSFYIGTRILNDMDFFRGKIDDIGLWNRVLTEQELKDIYIGSTCNVAVAWDPQSDTLLRCQKAKFSIVAKSDSAITYRWQRSNGTSFVDVADGSAYSGSKTNTLTVLAASSQTVGTYRCIVSTTQCADTSKVAALSLKNDIPGYMPRNGLVGWWPFDCNADDQSGNGNHGAVTGAVSAPDRTGKADKAYRFDGDGDFIEVPWSSSLSEMEMKNQFTVSTWVRDQSQPAGVKFPLMNMQHPSDDCGGWETFLWNSLFHVDLKCRQVVGNVPGNACRLTLTPDQWQHLVFTYDGTAKEYRLYSNGDIVCSDTLTITLPSTAGGKLYFGHSPLGPDEFSRGLLDDLGLWSRALTQAEVKRLYGDDCAGGQRRYALDSMKMAGDARYEGSAITLTPSTTFRAGSAWLPKKHVVTRGFDVRFKFRMRDGSDNALVDGGPQGADGITFVLQNSSPTSTGAAGDGIGYNGIASGLAVEFDAYQNPAFSDPSPNHIAVQVGDGQLIRPWHVAPYLRGIASSVPEFVADGRVYHARITLQGQRLSVYCDTTGALGVPLLTVDSIDIAQILKLDADGATYLGFTSATGFSQQQHELLELSIEDCDNLVSVDEDVSEPILDPSIRVVPMPARYEARLELSTPATSSIACRIFDVRGTEVATIAVARGSQTCTLPVSGLPVGTYRVQLQASNNVLVLPLLIAP